MVSIFPFPHSENQTVFKNDIWQEFCQNWPAEELFAPYSDGKNRDLGDPGRFGLYILGYAGKKAMEKLSPLQISYWHGFVKNQLRPVIYNEYVDFLPYIRARFDNNLADVEMQIFAVLVNCYKKLEVRVHTENPSAILTGLIYHNDTNDMTTGTSIYTPQIANFTHGGAGFMDFKDFELYKAASGHDNSMFTFLKTENSFHGVPATRISNLGQRMTVNWHIRLSDKTIEERYRVGSFWDLNDENDITTKNYFEEITKWQNKNSLDTSEIKPIEKQKFDEMYEAAMP